MTLAPCPLDHPTADAIWTATAEALGFIVCRSADVYASTDGRGRILIGVPETLDADDSLAQLVFHELCHALVQGEKRLASADWGLDNIDERDQAPEHACLRLQAYLADRQGLRAALRPTTVTRAFYENLGEHALKEPEENCRCVSLTTACLRTNSAHRWLTRIDEALRETAAFLATIAQGRTDG